MARHQHDGSDERNDSASQEREEDLTRARDALQSVPEMSEERVAEIRERIKRGYYKRSDVLERIAKRVSDHL